MPINKLNNNHIIQTLFTSNNGRICFRLCVVPRVNFSVRFTGNKLTGQIHNVLHDMFKRSHYAAAYSMKKTHNEYIIRNMSKNQCDTEENDLGPSHMFNPFQQDPYAFFNQNHYNRIMTPYVPLHERLSIAMEIQKFYGVGPRASSNVMESCNDPVIAENSKEQISGLISLKKSVRILLKNYHTTIPNGSINTITPQRYVIIKLCQTLYAFYGDIPDELSFLSRIMDRFGKIGIPMPAELSKEFGDIAMTQNCLSLLTAYRYYKTGIISQLYNERINMTMLKNYCPILNTIENGIYMANMGNVLNNKPNVEVFAVNPDDTTLIPEYNKEIAKQVCEQPNVDFFTKIAAQSKEYYVKYQDVKSGGIHAMKKSRLTITQGFYEYNNKQIDKFTNNYISGLKDAIKNLNLPKILLREHPYMILLEKLLSAKKSQHNASLMLTQFMRELQEATIDPLLNNLDISLTTDAGIDHEFIKLYKNYLEQRTQGLDHEYISYDIIFSESGKPDVVKIKQEVQKLIKLFPEDMQQSIWYNFERFGAGSENTITNK